MNISYKNKSGIYRIRSLVNDKVYIGSAVNIYNRWHHHKHYLVRGTHANSKLQRFVNKHGFDSLVFEVIELCDKEKLIGREQVFIDKEKPFFNVCQVAGNTLGVRPTEEARARLSASRKEKPTSGMLGKKHTKETKDAISAKAKERGLHPAFKAASKAANTGKRHTNEHRAKVALKQRKITPEQAQEVLTALSNGELQVTLAKRYNVSQRVICRVHTGVGCYSLDADYYAAACKRFEQHKAQGSLFIPDTPRDAYEQTDFLASVLGGA